MQPLSTPGYVYVLAHPELPAWFKVGRTYRPPHARARELSRTAWPSPLEVKHARFFWDSVTAEHRIHQGLLAIGRHRRREFFDASLPEIQGLIRAQPFSPNSTFRHAAAMRTPVWDAPWQNRVGNADSWAHDLDRLEEEWEAGAQEIASPQPVVRDRGWRRWMRVSSEGWAEGSRRLAEALYRAEPGPIGARRASWVYDAAGAQGLPGAGLRGAWLRTWGPDPDWETWSHALRDTWAHWGHRAWETWPDLVRETLLLERDSCARAPLFDQPARIHAAQAFPGWDRLPSPFSQVSP